MGFICRLIPVIVTVFFISIPAAVLAGNPVTASIPVSCLAEGSTETFVYTLNAESGDGNPVLIRELTLKDGQEGTFDIDFYVPGVYIFSASQKPGKRTDTAYSEKIYSVKAYVSEREDGELICEIIAYEPHGTEKTGCLAFTNTVRTVKTDEPAAPDTAAKKTDGSAAPDTAAKKTDGSAVPDTAANKTDAVRTGDAAQFLPGILSAVSSLAVIAGAVRKRKDQEEVKHAEEYV